ncbi:MAG: hypothetical protein AAGG02_06785 [Cyanobacteria bacterium P01_H01_bin.15]
MLHKSVKKIISLSVAVSTLLFSSTDALAGTFEFDFDKAPDGTVLDPYLLDTRPGQTIDGVRYSTRRNNIGLIWESLGVTISGDQGPRTPIGLFNSDCVPRGGTSENGFTRLCEGETPGNTNGDNDLATGTGFNPQGESAFSNPLPAECESPAPGNSVNYCTQPQGNVLIFEENRGDGNPDDDANNGTIRFDFDRNIVSTVRIGRIAVIDDIKATLTITFLDNTVFQEILDIQEENAVSFFGEDIGNLIPDKEVSFFTVQLAEQGGTSSGAVSSLIFTQFGDETHALELPEPYSLLGLVSLGLLTARKRVG